MQVDLELVAGQRAHATQFDLLADDGGLVVDQLSDGLAAGRSRESGLHGVGGDGGRGIRDLVGQRDEAVVLRDEVGLARELEDRDLAIDLAGGDEAFARRAVGALGVALRALQAQDLDGLLDVAVSLFESLLGVDHAGSELLAQRLDVGDREVCHGWRLLGCVSSRGCLGGTDARMTVGPAETESCRRSACA